MSATIEAKSADKVTTGDKAPVAGSPGKVPPSSDESKSSKVDVLDDDLEITFEAAVEDAADLPSESKSEDKSLEDGEISFVRETERLTALKATIIEHSWAPPKGTRLTKVDDGAKSCVKFSGYSRSRNRELDTVFGTAICSHGKVTMPPYEGKTSVYVRHLTLLGTMVANIMTEFDAKQEFWIPRTILAREYLPTMKLASSRTIVSAAYVKYLTTTNKALFIRKTDASRGRHFTLVRGTPIGDVLTWPLSFTRSDFAATCNKVSKPVAEHRIAEFSLLAAQTLKLKPNLGVYAYPHDWMDDPMVSEKVKIYFRALIIDDGANFSLPVTKYDYCLEVLRRNSSHFGDEGNEVLTYLEQNSTNQSMISTIYDMIMEAAKHLPTTTTDPGLTDDEKEVLEDEFLEFELAHQGQSVTAEATIRSTVTNIPEGCALRMDGASPQLRELLGVGTQSLQEQTIHFSYVEFDVKLDTSVKSVTTQTRNRDIGFAGDELLWRERLNAEVQFRGYLCVPTLTEEKSGYLQVDKLTRLINNQIFAETVLSFANPSILRLTVGVPRRLKGNCVSSSQYVDSYDVQEHKYLPPIAKLNQDSLSGICGKLPRSLPSVLQTKGLLVKNLDRYLVDQESELMITLCDRKGVELGTVSYPDEVHPERFSFDETFADNVNEISRKETKLESKLRTQVSTATATTVTIAPLPDGKRAVVSVAVAPTTRPSDKVVMSPTSGAKSAVGAGQARSAGASRSSSTTAETKAVAKRISGSGDERDDTTSEGSVDSAELEPADPLDPRVLKYKLAGSGIVRVPQWRERFSNCKSAPYWYSRAIDHRHGDLKGLIDKYWYTCLPSDVTWDGYLPERRGFKPPSWIKRPEAATPAAKKIAKKVQSKTKP